MNIFLIQEPGSFHYSVEQREQLLSQWFPRKIPKVVIFRYGGYYKQKENFLKEFEPGRDCIVFQTYDHSYIRAVMCDECLRQQIADKRRSENDRNINKILLEKKPGLEIQEYFRQDNTDRNTFQILRDWADKVGYEIR